MLANAGSYPSAGQDCVLNLSTSAIVSLGGGSLMPNFLSACSFFLLLIMTWARNHSGAK